jgi:exoribonuclease-2
MTEHGLEPDFPAAVLREVDTAPSSDPQPEGSVRDLRQWLWCSIDNDDSRDLDQLSVSEPADRGGTRVYVAIADVDRLVTKGSAVDQHAQANTTSIYTPVQIFPMLAERFSTDLTSLNPDEDRAAIVVQITVDAGTISGTDVFSAIVRNHAKLAYDSVAAWLDGTGPAPDPVARIPGLGDQLRAQNDVAAQLRTFRHEHGALNLETIQARAVVGDDGVNELRAERPNRAKQLIEDLMIAANGVTARFLAERKFPSIRRVVRSPERWHRIVALAREHGVTLPAEPDSRALEGFLAAARRKDPVRFPDLSLSVVKLMGSGEYVAEAPDGSPAGHFGLAVRDYTHSTAPNRRYPDLITQRLIKATLSRSPAPYSLDALAALARHCTDQEDAAAKVERLVQKAAAALILTNRIGDRFNGIVTGASPKGVWVRVFDPAVEGRIVIGEGGLDVGDRVTVKLIGVNPDRGFIDFARM